MSGVEIAVVGCLEDNYGFLLHDVASGQTACIDTPEIEPVLAEADRRGWRIAQIWNTHWHWDHTGGNERLRELTGCEVLGPPEVVYRSGCHVDRVLRDGDMLEFGGIRAEVIATPGHTLGHICYHLADEEVIFSGDTLFSGGCGRLFEGQAAQMWDSLKRLRSLSDRTLIYCAHEYTESNLAFAQQVDKDNSALQERMLQVRKLRDRGEPTIPVRLCEERRYNPFLRADDARIQSLQGYPGDAVGTFASLRLQKDVFR